MLFASGNFDPEGIPDPRTFDLSRDPNEHLSFGRGPHSCLGKHVAALEIKILLEELFQRIEYIRPTGPISYTNDNYARGVYSLPVEVKGT
jgi:cytochrome P450